MWSITLFGDKILKLNIHHLNLCNNIKEMLSISIKKVTHNVVNLFQLGIRILYHVDDFRGRPGWSTF